MQRAEGIAIVTIAPTASPLKTPSQSISNSGCVDGERKRGRQQLSRDEMSRRLHRVKRNYRHSKAIQNQNLIASDEASIGSSLVQLIKRADVHREKINGEECVSIVSIMLLRKAFKWEIIIKCAEDNNGYEVGRLNWEERILIESRCKELKSTSAYAFLGVFVL